MVLCVVGADGAWARIIDCEENDGEALLTNATLRYLSNLEPDREDPRSLSCQH